MTHIDIHTFAPVKSEVYQLLLAAHCYQAKYDALGDRLQHQTRAFLLEETTALRHIANGIILHLCNLDDDGSKWSLRAIRKELAKTHDPRISMCRCNELLKSYRVALNALKTKSRNEYIAHRNASEYPNPLDLPDYRTEFKQLITMAVDLCDYLWGARIEYGFRLGSRDPTLDFRADLGLNG